MIKPIAKNIRKIKPIIEEVVEQKLYEILGDPDEGLKLKLSVRRKLERSLKKRGKGVTAEKVAEELGLKW